MRIHHFARRHPLRLRSDPYGVLKDFCENNDRCLEDYIYNDDCMMDDVYEAIRDDVNYNGDIDLTVERVR